ncbi:MAG: stalk domain-containing protein [Desulfotomaculaceae bacterium]
MKFKKICTALTLTAILATNPVWPAGTTAYAQETVRQVVLTLGSNEALLNNAPCQLEIPPVVVNGTTFLPVRFVAEEILGAAVNWDPTTKTINIIKKENDVQLSLGSGQASVGGQIKEIGAPPFLKDGRTLVPLRFLAENLNMRIAYDAIDKTITIEEIITIETPEPVNMPPVITSMGLQSDEIRIGEEPIFNYTYENEAGEGIVDVEWSYQLAGDTRAVTGKPRAFFRPGEHKLFLRIKDTAGNWSETASGKFSVSEEEFMSEMAFKFSKLVYGEMFENEKNVNFNQYTPNQETTFERSGPMLHMSNSPEVASSPGILYQNDASGNFRLFYHHLNGSTERQYLYVIAENNGFEPVVLKTLKSGVGGPVNDYMSLGQTASMRYLSSQPASPVIINPGEKVILNPGLRHLNNKEAVTGMQDFQADGVITLSVVMGPEKAPEADPVETTPLWEEKPAQNVSIVILADTVPTDETSAETDAVIEPMPVKTPEQVLREKIDYLLGLPVLSRHPQQIRGVFPGGDCLVNIMVNDARVEKITLGKEDPDFDFWVEGFDPLTGDVSKSFGNYGVVYRIKISAPEKTGLLLNPRGSIFKGAFKVPEGSVYKAPATSQFAGMNRAAVLGVVEAGQTIEFIYTPPSGSDTPLVIALVPEKYWD